MHNFIKLWWIYLFKLFLLIKSLKKFFFKSGCPCVDVCTVNNVSSSSEGHQCSRAHMGASGSQGEAEDSSTWVQSGQIKCE